MKCAICNAPSIGIALEGEWLLGQLCAACIAVLKVRTAEGGVMVCRECGVDTDHVPSRHNGTDWVCGGCDSVNLELISHDQYRQEKLGGTDWPDTIE